MLYRKLGNTDIEVSLICLGTMTWGEQNTQDEAFAQLDYALEQGVNFIDTAELYPVPPKAESYGHTEAIIGNWLAARDNRASVVLASKVFPHADWLPYVREGKPRLNRQHLEKALDDSLTRLRTDYLDLYQLHWPDRDTNCFGQLGYEHNPDDDPVPLLETLEVLGEFVKAGKVRHVGVSNETPWGLMSFLKLAEQHRLPRMVSIQNPYSLLNRSFEVGLSEIAQREQCGLLAYSPLGFGVLSGKYLGNQRPDGARLSLFERFQRYSNPNGIRATEAYVNIARAAGLDPAQMALAYINSRDFLTANIIGATGMRQLRDNIESVAVRLSEEVVRAIEAVHLDNPSPCP